MLAIILLPPSSGIVSETEMGRWQRRMGHKEEIMDEEEKDLEVNYSALDVRESLGWLLILKDLMMCQKNTLIGGLSIGRFMES